MGAALVEDRLQSCQIGRARRRGRRAADGTAELEAGLVGEAENLRDVGAGTGEGGLGGGEGDAVDAKCLECEFFFGGGRG